jgi:hypothetical protein
MARNREATSEEAAQQEAQPATSDASTSTLFDLAKRNGQLFNRDPKLTRFQASDEHESPFKPTHQVADVYHGWSLHWRTKHQEVFLSDADYLAALQAAKLGKTHEPANRRDPELTARQQASREAALKGA